MANSSLRKTRTSSNSMAMEVITKVADHEGIDPMDLDRRLQDVVDVDALESLFPARSISDDDDVGYLVFAYHGHEITVTRDGEVSVTNRTKE